MSVSPVQPEKAELLIAETELGIDKPTNSVPPTKAYGLIMVTESGITKFVISKSFKYKW